MGSTTATLSLNGEDLLDYRFVDPTSHMQPWPIEETEIGPLSLRPIESEMPALTQPTTIQPAPTQQPEAQPSEIETARVAAKWRTNLTAKREEKTEVDQSKLPGPVLEDPGGNTEVLVVPKPATNKPTPAKPSSQPRDCYQAPPLSALTVSITLPAGKLPTNAAAECATQNAPTYDARLVCGWAVTEQHWSATCMHHRPLYFEEINAERYGYTSSYFFQPLISAGRFFATIPALPYKMIVDRPRDCIYTLGHYRPGSCVPRRASHLPAKLGALAVETGFIAGMILLIP